METSEPKTTGLASILTAASEQRVCPQHGPYEARSIAGRYWSSCPQCRAERDAQDAARAEEERRASERAAALSRLRQSAIPPRFADADFDSFACSTDGQRKALEVARSYADNFAAARQDGTSLIFCGRAGTGKTHLSVAIANRAIAAGYSALFTSVMRATRTVKETYRKDSDMLERDAVLLFVKPDLLILDEVGVQFGSDTEKLIIFEIINSRYEEVKPTIVISNLAKEGLEEYLGERAFDRLRENGGRLVVFDWESHRKRAA